MYRNKQHPIPEGYSFNFGTIKANMKCDERIIDDLLLMMQAAKAEGINLEICSPFQNIVDRIGVHALCVLFNIIFDVQILVLEQDLIWRPTR